MKKKQKVLLLSGIMLLAVAIIALLGLAFGSVSLSFSDLIGVLTGRNENGTAEVIVVSLRLPRVLGALLCGAAMAPAGMLLQSVTGNALCAPSIVGVNAGAGLATMLVLSLTPALYMFLPAAAFVGALGATLTVLALSRAGGKARRSTIILAGVAVSALCNAGTAYLSYRFPDALSSYAAFSVGGFAGTRMRDLFLPAIVILCSLLAAQFLAPRVNLLSLGDAMARSLGVRVGALRFACIVLASALCASAVSYAGLIGFVGLVVPHIVRRMAGNDVRLTLGLCALTGGALVCAADTLGRILAAPSELPCGILLAVIGVPFFLLLLIGKRGDERV